MRHFNAPDIRGQSLIKRPKTGRTATTRPNPNTPNKAEATKKASHPNAAATTPDVDDTSIRVSATNEVSKAYCVAATSF
jgi:hypothetical protein